MHLVLEHRVRLCGHTFPRICTPNCALSLGRTHESIVWQDEKLCTPNANPGSVTTRRNFKLAETRSVSTAARKSPSRREPPVLAACEATHAECRTKEKVS